MNQTITFKIGDKVERVTGDKRDRGEVIEVNELTQRVRINWTHYQQYEFVATQFDRNNEATKFRIDWTGIFAEYASQQLRTWAAIKSLKHI